MYQKNQRLIVVMRPGFVKLQVKQSMPGLLAEVNGIRLYQTVSSAFLKELLP
jgi:hypothetical protein